MKLITYLSKILFGDEELREDNIILKSRDLGDGKYEVAGDIVLADSHAQAINQWRNKHEK